MYHTLGIFKERSGLWLVTEESLQQMKHCPPKLLEEGYFNFVSSSIEKNSTFVVQ
jgi:hypothetical protein